MGNGQDRTPVLRSEDWWACFLGWFIIVLAIIGLHEVAAGKWAVSSILPAGPKFGKWTSLAGIFPKGFGTSLGQAGILFVFMAVITSIGGIFMKFDLKRYIPGFLVIFVLALISMIISKQAFFSKWGIEYVIFALIFGLIIGNFL